MHSFEAIMHEAETAGLRVIQVRGLTLWEAPFTMRHQRAVGRIQASLSLSGGVAASAVHIRFPDGSCLCPDLAIFPHEPDEIDRITTLLPEAVVEVISRDYAAKDLIIGVPFYQQVGIRDIVVLDPDTAEVRHWQAGHSEKTYTSPVLLTFLCGCTATV